MFNVTLDSIRACTSSSRDLVYDLAGEFSDVVSAVRLVRGDEVAEAFLLMIRNMDDAGAFFPTGRGDAENGSDND